MNDYRLPKPLVASRRVQRDNLAFKLAGVWHELDAEEMLRSLDRMRHESKPTPPIDTL
jgi:hypothetical protein